MKQKLQVLAVYSLAENEMQLPFAVTLSSILSENEKVLLLDLQENSGLSQLMGEFYSSGMDHSYVALCGVAEHALMQLLNDAPHISQIALCLDHDKAGIQARERIKKNLSERGYHMVFSLFQILRIGMRIFKN